MFSLLSTIKKSVFVIQLNLNLSKENIFHHKAQTHQADFKELAIMIMQIYITASCNVLIRIIKKPLEQSD